MKTFVKITTISNISGRSDYITGKKKDEERDERVVITSPPTDWKPYIEFEKSNRKTDKENNQGRELTISLPNEWFNLDKGILFERVQKLSEECLGKKTDFEFAVHWNKSRSNFHVHILFSERTQKQTKEIKIYDRDIYLTADGKIARAKKDRAKDERGKDLPPVHRKGEVKEITFTEKDTRYKSRQYKYDLREIINNNYRTHGVNIKQFSEYRDREPFHYYHQGKGKDASTIKRKNEVVKICNYTYQKVIDRYPKHKDRIKKHMIDCIKAGEVPNIYTEKAPGVYQGLLRFKSISLERYQEIITAAQQRQREEPKTTSAMMTAAAQVRPSDTQPKPAHTAVKSNIKSAASSITEQSPAAMHEIPLRPSQHGRSILDGVKKAYEDLKSTVNALLAQKFGIFEGKKKKARDEKVAELTDRCLEFCLAQRKKILEIPELNITWRDISLPNQRQGYNYTPTIDYIEKVIKNCEEIIEIREGYEKMHPNNTYHSKTSILEEIKEIQRELKSQPRENQKSPRSNNRDER